MGFNVLDDRDDDDSDAAEVKKDPMVEWKNKFDRLYHGTENEPTEATEIDFEQLLSDFNLNDDEQKKKKKKFCFNGYSRQLQEKGKIPRPDSSPDYYPQQDSRLTTWRAKLKYYAKEIWRKVKRHIYEYKWFFLPIGGCMLWEVGRYILWLFCGKKSNRSESIKKVQEEIRSKRIERLKKNIKKKGGAGAAADEGDENDKAE